MSTKNRLESLDDGYVAFQSEDGERWKHKDIEAGRTGPGYRVFISDRGEERRYVFAPRESLDATILDLRDQLKRAQLTHPTPPEPRPAIQPEHRA